jgi:hypothetical protein
MSNSYQFQTINPVEPLGDPMSPVPTNPMPAHEPDPYPVTDPIPSPEPSPEPEPFPTPPEPIPEYPPDVNF